MIYVTESIIIMFAGRHFFATEILKNSLSLTLRTNLALDKISVSLLLDSILSDNIIIYLRYLSLSYNAFIYCKKW
jgi:hypothetical protein